MNCSKMVYWVGKQILRVFGSNPTVVGLMKCHIKSELVVEYEYPINNLMLSRFLIWFQQDWIAL